MNRVNFAVRIQIRCLSWREEHESFVAREEAVNIIVEIVMLCAGGQSTLVKKRFLKCKEHHTYQSGRSAVF